MLNILFMFSKEKRFRINKNLFIEIISYFFIMLFTYAAFSKLLDYQEFKTQLTQSPLLANFANYIVWLVPGLEILIAVLLLTSKLRLVALFSSFSLMLVFTTYIFMVLNFSDRVPCSCGGILENMGWTEHLIFNIAATCLALFAILFFDQPGKAPIVMATKNSRHEVIL